MIARIWPPVTYWLTAPDAMVATAVEVLETEAAELDRIRGGDDE